MHNYIRNTIASLTALALTACAYPYGKNNFAVERKYIANGHVVKTEVETIDTENCKLTGFEVKSEVTKELLVALSNQGPKMSVITDGGNGAYVFDGVKCLHCGVLPVDAYERTGAGDAFGSGFLSAVIKGKTMEEALVWGTVNSASVIGYVGAQKGLLKEEDMDTWVERAKSSGVKVEEM